MSNFAKAIAFAWAIAWPIIKMVSFLEYLVFFGSVFLALAGWPIFKMFSFLEYLVFFGAVFFHRPTIVFLMFFPFLIFDPK